MNSGGCSSPLLFPPSTAASTPFPFSTSSAALSPFPPHPPSSSSSQLLPEVTTPQRTPPLPLPPQLLLGNPSPSQLLGSPPPHGLTPHGGPVPPFPGPYGLLQMVSLPSFFASFISDREIKLFLKVLKIPERFFILKKDCFYFQRNIT